LEILLEISIDAVNIDPKCKDWVSSGLPTLSLAHLMPSLDVITVYFGYRLA
jgi:hypothetical protein